MINVNLRSKPKTGTHSARCSQREKREDGEKKIIFFPAIINFALLISYQASLITS